MDSIFKWLLGALGTVGTWCAYLLGGWDSALTIMFVVMGLDYATGIIVALMKRSSKTPDGGFQSSVAFAGITKKLLMLIIVAVAVAVDRLMGTDGICRLATIGFYSANEGMSIIENASKIGVPFPSSLLVFLDRIRKKNEGAIGPDQTGEEENAEIKQQ